MNFHIARLGFLFVGLALSFGFSTQAIADGPPIAPVKPVVDDYHGTKIIDPYRYMEEWKNPDVQKWVKAQADYAEKILTHLPGRDALLKRIEELDAGAPYSIGGIQRQPNGNLFYFKQLASENVSKFYHRDGKTGKERLLIDPDKFPKKNPKDHFTLSFTRVSPDGTKILYGFAASGSELTTLKIFDLADNKDLPDTIDRMEAEYAPPYWLADGKSFVYSRRRKIASDAPPTEGYKFTQAFLHTLGTDPDRDSMVFAEGVSGSPKMGEMDFPAVIVPKGSKWAIGQIKHGDETDITLYAIPTEQLGSQSMNWSKICGREDQVTDFAVRGDDIYLLTAKNAPRFQLIRTPIEKPDLSNATVLVPPGKYVVESIGVAKDALYVGILDGVPNKILRIPYQENPKPEMIEFPKEEPSGFMNSVRSDMPGIFVQTLSWTREGNLYEYDPETKKLTDTKLRPKGKFAEPDFLTSKEVLVASHDGVKVPLSIVYRKDIKFDGSNPTLMSGYGGYGITTPVHFSPRSLAWLEKGGILATAHVRGGGSFGKEWHHAARRSTKPNTWKDFIACGEYLVKEKFTSPEKLAGQGGSAGGILIGRAITERPDLFGAAHIAVGCTDMLRFETTMNGPPNIPEYGTTTKKEEFPWLLEMSTFHQIKDGVKYPAVLLTHGVNDPRVEPWMSAKSTARFQAASKSDKPVLFRVDYHSGHGIGSTRKQSQEQSADVFAFLFWQLGEPSFQPKK